MEVTVNNEPVPVTTGSPGVRWDDTAPVTYGEVAAFRLLMERTGAALAAEKQRADEAEAALTDLGRRISRVIGEAVAGERERILAASEGITVTLSRPGNGPAHWEETEMVPLAALRDLIAEGGPS